MPSSSLHQGNCHSSKSGTRAVTLTHLILGRGGWDLDWWRLLDPAPVCLLVGPLPFSPLCVCCAFEEILNSSFILAHFCCLEVVFLCVFETFALPPWGRLANFGLSKWNTLGNPFVLLPGKISSAELCFN